MNDTTSYTAGDRVRIIHSGQVDHGVVVTATHDEDGRRIAASRVAVAVENGQGTWGFIPGSLTKITRQTIASDAQIDELSNAIALQAAALSELHPAAPEFFGKVRLLGENVRTLEAWTADRKPFVETANRRAAVAAVAAVETTGDAR